VWKKYYITIKRKDMKNIFNGRILTVFIASAIFVSCSKENLYLGKSSETNSTAKMVPVYNYGGISGTLTPAPYYSVLKIYNEEENFGTSCYPDLNGNFKIGDLVPGIYRIMVVFIPKIPGTVPVGEYSYFEIRGIIVEPGMVTELGDVVILPK